MSSINRRQFIAGAAALGATVAWGGVRAARSRVSWHERRDFYAEGVASGDPQHDSVILWTRYSGDASRLEAAPTKGAPTQPVRLVVEIADDEAFEHIVSSAHTTA